MTNLYKRKTIIMLALFIIIVMLANNMHAMILEAVNLRVEYKETPWYQVEDWEKEVCSKWGGTQFAGQEAVTTGRKISFGAMTATMQGKKLKTPEQKYIYEVGWYIESFSELTDYEITMVNGAKEHRVDSGTLAPEAGTVGYEVYNLTENYNQLRLTYTDGSITTPIIGVR